jgi:hypothetical protein
MLGKAALFLFGALQHAGVPIEPLHEPVIDSAESQPEILGVSRKCFIERAHQHSFACIFRSPRVR